MKRQTIWGSLAVALFLLFWGFASQLGNEVPKPTVTPIPWFHGTLVPNPVERLQEDDPGWDCHTMGNRICGIDR